VFAAVGVREIDEVNAGHATSPSRRTRRSDKPVGCVEHKDIVGVEHGIELLARLELMHAMQHRDPIQGIAMQMHEAFRAGDFGHLHGRRKRMDAGSFAISS